MSQKQWYVVAMLFLSTVINDMPVWRSLPWD